MRKIVLLGLLAALLLIVSCSDNNVFRLDGAICKVDRKGYVSIQDAVDAIVSEKRSNAVIEILFDIDEEVRSINRGGVIIPASFNGSITIDLNGHEFEIAQEETESAFSILGGELVIKNGKVSNYNTKPVFNVDDSSLVLRNIRLRGRVSESIKLNNGSRCSVYGDDEESTFLFGRIILDKYSTLSLDGGRYRISEIREAEGEKGKISIKRSKLELYHNSEARVREIISSMSKEDRDSITIDIVHTGERKGGISATCTEEGVITYYECSYCHKLFSDMNCTNEITQAETIVPALGHKINHRVAKEATCEEMGNIEHWGCVRCNTYFTNEDLTETATYMEVFSSPLGHDYPSSWTIDKNPTCLEEGSRSKTCSRCSNTILDTIPPLSHIWPEEWSIDKSPTCLEEGSKSKTCSRCGSKTEVSIPKLSHSWPEEWTVKKEATCKESGYKIKKCSSCGSEERAEIPMLSHIWPDEWVIDKEPTCTEEGLKTKTCTLCGEKNSVSIEKIPHEYGEWNKDEEGHWKECNICHRKDAEDGHVYGEWVIDRERAVKSHECRVCGYKEEVIYHDLIHFDASEPTCTENGNIEYYKCSLHENEYFADSNAETPLSSASIVISSLGHNKSLTLSFDSSSHYYECTRCHARLEEENHNWICILDKYNEELHLQRCSICGRTDSLKTYDSDENYHWEVCGVNNDWSSKKKNIHYYVDGKCVICGRIQ